MGVREPDDNDYCFPFFLGVLEFAIYPVLMATEYWTFIGAWLGFKGVSQWKRWSDKRSVFNRFLIGNAIFLLISYLLAKKFMVLIGRPVASMLRE